MTDAPPLDRHVRRSGSDYTHAFLQLLPQGQAWPREQGSTLVQTCDGLSEYWGFVDGRAADLLERESDPRKTIELLPEWERAWGLPDPCFPSATTIGERQRMLVLYMTYLGGQSRQYFIDLMAWLGYTIEIQEFAPFMAGISQVGDTRPTKLDEHGNRVIDTIEKFSLVHRPRHSAFLLDDRSRPSRLDLVPRGQRSSRRRSAPQVRGAGRTAMSHQPLEACADGRRHGYVGTCIRRADAGNAIGVRR